MISSEPLPLMTQTVANSGSIYNNYRSPTASKLTLEQQYNQLAQQMLPQQQIYSDPYSDYLSVLNSCTDVTREKILQDERYIQIYMQCKNGLDSINYARLMPEYLGTEQGRIMISQLHTITKTLKDEYTQLDLQRERESAELEKRLTEREKRLEEKERQIDEMLSKVNSVQSQQPVQQSYAQQEQQHSPAPQQNQNKNKQYQNSNQNKPQNSGGIVNE